MAAKTGAELLKDVTALLTKVTEQSDKTSKNWSDIAKSVAAASKEFDRGMAGSSTKMKNTHSQMVQMTTMLRGFFTGQAEHAKTMAKEAERLSKEYQAQSHPGRSPSRQPAAIKRLFKEAQEAAAKATKEYEAHLKINTALATIFELRASPAIGYMAKAMGLAVYNTGVLNKYLQQASSDWETRAKLSYEIANTQAATGASTNRMAQAASALVKYGFDLRSNFREVLETVVKMDEGLGVTVEDSAMLAVLSQRIGSNFKAIADGIARVKADTALSAQEAAKFGIEISKAIALLRPGAGGLAAEVIEYVDRLGGALKEVGGNAGDIKDLLIGFTKQKGIPGAAMLGLTPDMLSSEAGTRAAVERFTKFVNLQLQGTFGAQRAFLIDQIAEMFGTTAEMVGNADAMLKKFNATTRHATDLTKEWQQQTADISEAFGRIRESGAAMMQQILLPFLQVFRPVMQGVAYVMQFIAKNSWAVVTVGTLMIGTFALLTWRIAKLTREMIKAAIATEFWQNAIKSGGAAGGAGGIFGPLVRAAAAWMPRLGFLLTRGLPVVTALLAGIAAGTYAVKHNTLGINDGVQALFRATVFKGYTHGYQAPVGRLGDKSYSQVLSEAMALQSRGASVLDIQKYLLENVQKIPQIYRDQDTTHRNKMIANVLQGSLQNLQADWKTEMRYGSLTAQSQKDRDTQLYAIEVQKQTSRNTELLRQVQENSAREAKEYADKQAAEKSAEIQRRALRAATDRAAMGRAFAAGGPM